MLNILRGKSDKSIAETAAEVVPSGVLLHLQATELIQNTNNPRHLFDPEPLKELKKNIREHGVLVPLTVYQSAGQTKYTILDGARRHRCCIELLEEGVNVPSIPANVVSPPTKIAGLLYMFSIHNFREGWELMPTALSLKVVMEDLGIEDNKAIGKLTGLSDAQVERCKKLLAFPQRFQDLSLDPNPVTRIPSNFWIEAYPLLELCQTEMPDLVKEYGRDGITDKLVEKYRAKSIKSVIHFRRVMEAYENADSDNEKADVKDTIRSYITEKNLETRSAFDKYVVEERKIRSAIEACDGFVIQLEKLKLDYTLDRDNLKIALEKVRQYTDQLIEKLRGEDAPPVSVEQED